MAEIYLNKAALKTAVNVSLPPTRVMLVPVQCSIRMASAS